MPLETTDNSVVFSISDMEVMNDRFYVLNGGCASILIFDKQGHDLGSIDDQGEGPNEYFRIVNMDLDRLNKQILVNDGFSKKLLVYNRDGNWVKTIPFEFIQGIVVPFMNDRFVQVNDGREQYVPEDMRPWNLTLFDDQGHPLAIWLQAQTPNQIDFSAGMNVCTLDNDELLFSPLFLSILYTVGVDSIVPTYRLVNRLDGYKSLSESDLQNVNYIFGNKQCSYEDYVRRLYIFPDSFRNNNHYLCVGLIIGKENSYVLYDKESSRTEVINLKDDSSSDVSQYSVEDALG